MKTNILTILILLAIKISFAQNACNNVVRTGEGTYYDFKAAGGIGNCSFDDTKISPFLIGAMNDEDYGTADFCGACVHVDGPIGSVKVQIIDRCPECVSGDIDLSPEAFEKIAKIIDGRINISWHVVPCEVNGNITFHYKEGSNKWWLGIQVRNTVNHVAKLEIKQNGNYITLERQRYNYFIAESISGFVGPLQFRITDVYGNVIEETNIAFSEALINTEVNGTQQFPDCSVTAIEEQAYTSSNYIKNNTLILDVSVSSFKLFSLNGNEILHGNHANEMNLLSLQKGFYILSTLSGQGTHKQKIF